MLKENWRLISRLERVGDVIIVILAFFAAYYGRGSFMHWNELFGWGFEFTGSKLAPIGEYNVLLLASVVSYAVSLQALGAYTSMRLSSPWYLLRIAILSSIFAFFVLSSVAFLLRMDLSRSLVILFCCLAALGLTSLRYVVLEVLRFWRRRGSNFRNIVLCGIGPQTLQLALNIHAKPEMGIRVRAFATLEKVDDGLEKRIAQFRQSMLRNGVPRIGRVLRGREAIARALQEYAIDEVIFADCGQCLDEVKELVDLCALQGVRTTIAADLFSLGVLQSHMSYFGGMPLIHFQTPPGDAWQLSVKRVSDFFLSGLMLICLAPIFLLIALAIKWDSRGPVFFVQRRMGLHGRIFSCFKFRSMEVDAEKKLPALLEKNEMAGPAFKMREDPRITRVGAFLRRYSLDELPQLWNVFIGDMSLVGPRTPIPGEVSMYERKDRRRLSMRPGLTCTWQVSGRNDIRDFERWVEMDLDYMTTGHSGMIFCSCSAQCLQCSAVVAQRDVEPSQDCLRYLERIFSPGSKPCVEESGRDQSDPSWHNLAFERTCFSRESFFLKRFVLPCSFMRFLVRRSAFRIRRRARFTGYNCSPACSSLSNRVLFPSLVSTH